MTTPRPQGNRHPRGTSALPPVHARVLLTLLIHLCTFLPIPAAAQAVHLSGYIAELPSWQRLNGIQALIVRDRDIWSSLTRVRARAQAEPWEGYRINAEYELAVIASTAMLVPLDAGRTNRQLFDLTWSPAGGAHTAIRHTIDRLSLQHDEGNLRVILGRQRIAWGSGRVWNPTDLFNPINPASWDKIEKDGADALLVRYTAGDFTDLTAVVNPRGAPGTNWALRGRTSFDPVDLSLIAGVFDRRATLGADLAGSLLGAGLRFEGILSLRPGASPSTPALPQPPASHESDTYIRYIAGVDFQFSPLLYMLAEYQHNGEGTGDARGYDIARLMRGDILNVGRDYLVISAMLQLHPLVTGSLSAVRSFTDASGYAAASAVWSAADDLTLTLGLLLPFGAAFTEYTLYPTALHANLTWWF